MGSEGALRQKTITCPTARGGGSGDKVGRRSEARQEFEEGLLFGGDSAS